MRYRRMASDVIILSTELPPPASKKMRSRADKKFSVVHALTFLYIGDNERLFFN